MEKRGRKNKKYSAEFKTGVILDMQEHNYTSQIKRWERIYLEEGAEGLMTER